MLFATNFFVSNLLEQLKELPDHGKIDLLPTRVTLLKTFEKATGLHFSLRALNPSMVVRGEACS